MARTSFAIVFALVVVALPIRSVFAYEVKTWVNPFNGQVMDVGAPEKAQPFDWVLEANNLENGKKFPTIFEEAPAPSPNMAERRGLEGLEIESPEMAPITTTMESLSDMVLRRGLVESLEMAPTSGPVESLLNMVLRRDLAESREMAPTSSPVESLLDMVLRRGLAESPEMAPTSGPVESLLNMVLRRGLVESPEMAPRRSLVESPAMAPRRALVERSAPVNVPASY